MRNCDKCGIEITEGFVISGGEEYFCNNHEPSYFKDLYGIDLDGGETYWTQWETTEDRIILNVEGESN